MDTQRVKTPELVSVLSPIVFCFVSRLSTSMSFRVCPNLLSQGACTTEGCALKHDVHLCQTCRVYCKTGADLRCHLNGKKHARRVRAQASPHPSFCKLCNVSLGPPWNYSSHIQGRAHKALLEKQDADSDNESDSQSVPHKHLHCHVCDMNVLERLWSSHIVGLGHRKKERFASIQAAFDEADKDKHGITVSSLCDGEGTINFGFIELDSLQSQPTHSTQVTLLLTTPGDIKISGIRLSSTKTIRSRSSQCVVLTYTGLNTNGGLL